MIFRPQNPSEIELRELKITKSSVQRIVKDLKLQKKKRKDSSFVITIVTEYVLLLFFGKLFIN